MNHNYVKSSFCQFNLELWLLKQETLILPDYNSILKIKWKPESEFRVLL